jgi:hypothetical protein
MPEATNPNPCPVCRAAPRVGYDTVTCDNPYCPLEEVYSFTRPEWDKLTAGPAQRARAARAIAALREVRRLCAVFDDPECGRSSIELLEDIRGTVRQALKKDAGRK